MMRQLSQAVANLRGFLVRNTSADLAAQQCLTHIEQFEKAPGHALGDAVFHAGEAVRAARCNAILHAFGTAGRWMLAGQLIAKGELPELVGTMEEWDATIRKQLTDSGASSLGERGATPLAGWDKVVRDWFEQRQQDIKHRVPRIGPEFRWIEISGRRLDFDKNWKLRRFLAFLHRHLHEATDNEFELGDVVAKFKDASGLDLRSESLKHDSFKGRTNEFGLLFRRIGGSRASPRNRDGKEAEWYLWLVPLDTPIG